MPKAMVVGSGGREHALVEALLASPSKPEVIAAPGNPGVIGRASQVDVKVDDLDRLTELGRDMDLVVVGPEAPLVAGLADRLRAEGVAVLGPSAAAAQLEGSKRFAKTVMEESGVPTARWGSFTQAKAAIEFARTLPGAVIKADGLAAGKGVEVTQTFEAAQASIERILSGAYGGAGSSIVVEERLIGEELSVIALSDGQRLSVMAPAQDHKRIFDDDQGPNTGGMGAYSPAPRGTPQLLSQIEQTCLLPIVERMREKGAPFVGVLYAGLMLTEQGPKVLEYNVRFGDPEAQAILPRLDEDAYALFLACAKGSLEPRPARFSERAAMTVVLASEGYPSAPKKGDVIEGLAEASALDDVFIFHAGTRKEGDRVLTAGGRVLGVTALGDQLLDAGKRAYEAVDKISWRGMQHRTDIGARALGQKLGRATHDDL